MRLPKIEHGHPLGVRIRLGLMGLLLGRRTPDVVRVLAYRPEFFGTAYRRFVGPAMEAPARWNRGERELFAAFTSRLNQCLF